METIITSEAMKLDGKEFYLVDVSHGLGYVGVCNVSQSEGKVYSEAFYMGNQALINISTQNKNNIYADKMIFQSMSREEVEDGIMSRITLAVDNYFLYGQGLMKSIHPVLELLVDGLYVIHTNKMFPSDGAGNFFWSSYVIKHEVTGTSEYNLTMGKNTNYSPCYLIPTLSLSGFSDSRLRIENEKIKNGKNLGGIAFHISGLFAALLDGHHAATATLLNDSEFNCIIIEPVNSVVYESDEAAEELGREPRVIGLSCPYAKIPLDIIPKSIIENFLLKRRKFSPMSSIDMKKKSEKTLKIKSNKQIPLDVHTKASHLPDVDMVESANAISHISDEQIEALLNGETSIGDQIIISNNYYMSIVTACNYLQYTDFNRFLSFSEAIIDNTDLIATHQYIANRLKNLMSEKINSIFEKIYESEDPVYSGIKPIAEKYIVRYKDYTAKREQVAIEQALSKERLILDAKKQVEERSRMMIEKLSGKK